MVVHVVGHASWRARELAAAGLEVRSSLGWNVPVVAPGDCVWAPMEWMARAERALRATGRPAWRLVDAGPSWLASLPAEVTGRPVAAMTLEEASVGAVDGLDWAWWKPANCKVESLPARRSSRSDFVAAAQKAGLPTESRALASDDLELVEEHRVYVLDGVPVTSSPYLWHRLPSTTAANGPVGWDQVPDLLAPAHGTSASSSGPAYVEAAERAGWCQLSSVDVMGVTSELLDQVGPAGVPPAIVVDVALTSDGRMVVLEANPVWSSSWYGADLTAVAHCLTAAIDPTGQDPARSSEWAWEPDPWLVARAERQRLLDVTT